MSTRARKERKAQPIAADRKLVKQQKVGTPVEDRIENRPKTIRQLGSWKATRFGLAPAAARRLTDRGIDRRFEGPAEK